LHGGEGPPRVGHPARRRRRTRCRCQAKPRTFSGHAVTHLGTHVETSPPARRAAMRQRDHHPPYPSSPTLVRYDNTLVTTIDPPFCAACGSSLAKPPRGRMPRFCGVACRMAAYRRRRQELPETTPRWAGPRGRLCLSRRAAFEREQIDRLRSAQRLERWRAAQAEGSATSATASERRLVPAPLADAQVPAIVPRKHRPLSDDWMFRVKPR